MLTVLLRAAKVKQNGQTPPTAHQREHLQGFFFFYTGYSRLGKGKGKASKLYQVSIFSTEKQANIYIRVKQPGGVKESKKYSKNSVWDVS